MLETEEATFCLSALGDCPLKSRLDRAHFLTDVVTIEAEARFKAERVSGSQANHLRVVTIVLKCAELADKALNSVVGNRNFKSVFARVAQSRNDQITFLKLKRSCRLHKREAIEHSRASEELPETG